MVRHALRALMIGFVVLCACLAGMPTACASRDLTPQQLREDLDALVGVIDQQHPDLRHSTDPVELSSKVASLRRRLNHAMTRDEAWRTLATLNPVLADGHLFIAFPDWRKESAQHLERGGAFFPFEVYVDPHGAVFVRSKLGGEPSTLAGARIETINGVSASKIANSLLERVHGDTPLFRSDLLSKRWWLYYWKEYGAPLKYRLRIGGRSSAAVAAMDASREKPLILQIENSFERQFMLELLPENTALLTIGSFAWPDKERFFEFTRDAFSRVRNANVGTLLIDVRSNGGGDDDMWQNGILRYVASQPYRNGSRYALRIVEGHQDEGEVIGEVVRGDQDKWIQPETDNPLHFSGKTYVLVGAGTYSSAILFANVIHDCGFGAVAGVGGSARTRQSGGVQKFVLPHSGLVLWWPRFVLSRPSGAPEPQLLTPDIPLEENPYDPNGMVKTFLQLADPAQHQPDKQFSIGVGTCAG
ncbi:MAG: S41 family peptidase [Steroidobacteraceae bacterium]